MYQSIVLAAAVLGSHIVFHNRGFRQKDVRFFMELFANWLDSKDSEVNLRIHNTQIMRYLEQLNKEGFVQKRTSGGTKHFYQLTRAGVMEMARQVVEMDSDPLRAMPSFFFVYQFVINYKHWISESLLNNSQSWSRSLVLELEEIFDEKQILESAIRSVEFELKRLDLRISDSEKTSVLYQKMKNSGAKEKEIFKLIDDEYPYELHHQRRLSEVLNEMAPSLASWELGDANKTRIQFMWKPRQKWLQDLLRLLKEMRRQDAA